MKTSNIYKPLSLIFNRVITQMNGLLCLRSAGMIFPVADVFYNFNAKHVVSHEAYRPNTGTHPMTMMCAIQRLAFLGKNDFELLVFPNCFWAGR